MAERTSRNVLLSDKAWELAQLAAESCHPETTRPAWIDDTIVREAKKVLKHVDKEKAL